MKKPRLEVNAILDVTPVMSVIVHLIPMLLLSVRLLALAQLQAAGPVLPSAPAPSDEAYAEQLSKRVGVGITERGFSVIGASADFLPCNGPCTPDTYDYAGLNRAMVDAKQSHPSEKRVIVAPAAEVPYDVVVRVMEAARVRAGTQDLLFPEPLLASPPEGTP